MTDDGGFQVTLGECATSPLKAMELMNKVVQELSMYYDNHIQSSFPHKPFRVRNAEYDFEAGTAIIYLGDMRV